jgi:hypothetical protein
LKDDELGTFAGAGQGAITADGFGESFGEGAGGIEDPAGYGFLVGGGEGSGQGEQGESGEE